jgi:acylphosphatase
MDEQQLHALVTGRVQGVSFRYYTTRAARQFDLTGWVRNLPDGRVEVLAEGSRSALDRLVTFLHQGPPAANVTAVEIEWHPSSGEFSGFRTRY